MNSRKGYERAAGSSNHYLYVLPPTGLPEGRISGWHQSGLASLFQPIALAADVNRRRVISSLASLPPLSVLTSPVPCAAARSECSSLTSVSGTLIRQQRTLLHKRRTLPYVNQDLAVRPSGSQRDALVVRRKSYYLMLAPRSGMRGDPCASGLGTSGNSGVGRPGAEALGVHLHGSSTYGNENTPLAPSESRSQKSADGRMATGAGLAEWEQTHGKKKAKCVLTSTGLLMEGVEA